MIFAGQLSLAENVPPGSLLDSESRPSSDESPFNRDAQGEPDCSDGCDPARIYVDDDLVECPDADYMSIQEAVDASDPGDEVIVFPGTYNEQVKILHDLTLKGRNAVKLLPSPVLANSTTIGGGDVATGLLFRNVVTNHVYAPCVSWDDCPAAAAGILLVDVDSADVKENTITRSQVGVWVIGDGNRVKRNNISDNLVYDGIALEGNDNIVADNQITASDESGIYIGGDHNRVVRNRINEAPWGIWEAWGVGNMGLFSNEFFNTEQTVVSGYGIAAVAGSDRSSSSTRGGPNAIRP